MLKKLMFSLPILVSTSLSVFAQSSFNYPEAKKIDQVDGYHGVKVMDPYRWLEDIDSNEARSWIDAQNQLTNEYLSKITQRDAIKKRLIKLWNYEKYSNPFKAGKHYFYSKNDGLQNQNVLYITDSINDPGRVFFDPNKLSNDGTAALVGSSFSNDGRFWAYGIAVSGSDRTEWHIRNVETGKDLLDTLEPNRHGGVSWLLDNSGFYYSRFVEVTGKSGQENSVFENLYFHKLGTSQSEDYLVYQPFPGHFTEAQVSEDGNWLILAVSKGSSTHNMIYFKRLDQEKTPIIPLVNNLDASYGFIGNDGANFYFQTDKDASKGKVTAINVLAVNPTFRDIIPESRETLLGVSLINNQFIMSYLKDAHSQIKIHDIKGKFIREIALPSIGTVAGFNGKRKDTETFYTYSSYNTPPTIYLYNMNTGQSKLFCRAKVDLDPNSYKVEQIFYKSKDGTRIPMFIMHKTSIQLDGNNPTILYGYGGFNIPMIPQFSLSLITWMDMGGVYAVANLRGGSEYGESWHQAGMKLNKQNVFDDFISAGEWLIANKYTSNEKLAIFGASNGGLLVGAVLNQRPDLFGAAVPAVGVMDMLRFGKFTIGKAWEVEYGSPDNPEEFRVLYGYSPLHNIKQDTKYPATLITTADHDDRVFPAHSFKYAATLQDAQSGDAPILIRIETKAGHGTGKPTDKQIQEVADVYAFLMKNLKINCNQCFRNRS
ncbi:prolyl oligopeptidase family serine peptidase [Legionella longbeachae]|uniref:prolyl oligopeptidase family serine peptidase n=1 Tax=Legionella longbeachae TaxID=450 RepID=UPI0012458195|nr:prolyl oligopeptidase family serine peptidase [Legionella longbeachae]QEY51795.1 S9 family peptidase [Legionella longbeachae]